MSMLLFQGAWASGSASAAWPHTYPYGEKVFTRFVGESFRVRGNGNPKGFYSWFSDAVKSDTGASLDAWIKQQRAELKRGKYREACVRAFGASVHKLIKHALPKFSLDRGYEFAYAQSNGERQCLLQSVLIAGLAQKAGVNAGTAMVWSNEQGQESNLGHVVSVFALSEGGLLLVDASEPTPFARHRGLFLRRSKGGGFSFARPVYGDGRAPDRITGWTSADSARKMGLSALAPLDVSYLESQFDFYRGERAPAGLLATQATPAGLGASLAFLQKAVKENGSNPLAVYSMGRTLKRMGQADAARGYFVRALQLYQRFGWVPEGPRTAAGG